MLGEVRGTVRFKEPLTFYTSLRTGGPADTFVAPQGLDDVRHTLSFVVLKLEGCLARSRRTPAPPMGGSTSMCGPATTSVAARKRRTSWR
jgi:hypothetical protein